MSTIFALSNIVIKELYRRKDFYVLFVMTAVITLLMGSVNFFHDTQIVRILKSICLLLIWISTLVIAITTTARQIPAEREARTIFPLLAKPVTRLEVIAGKFTGCWFACGVALVTFYLFFSVVTGTKENHWPVALYFQAAWLQWMMLGVVVAMVLLGSVAFTAPSSNATICFVIVVGILLLGHYLNGLAVQQPEPLRSIVYSLYFTVPHLEWYDIRDFVVNDHAPVKWSICALASAYALSYIVTLLAATWLVFRRKPLNL